MTVNLSVRYVPARSRACTYNSRASRRRFAARRKAPTAVLSLLCAAGLARATVVYYVGPNLGAWSNASAWSTASGGPPNAAVPVDGDSVFMDVNKQIYMDISYTGSGLLDLDIGFTGSGLATVHQLANAMKVASEMRLGSNAGTFGAYDITGGTLTITQNVSPAQLLVGWNGNGVLDITGTAVVDVGSNVNVGQNNGSQGAVHQGGGSLTIGAANNTGRSLYLGRFAGATGTYDMSSFNSTPSLTIYGSLLDGYAGSGTFTQGSGTVTIVGANNPLSIGATAGSTGSYTMNGGTLNVQGGDIDVGGGVGGGTGTFTVNSGSSVSVGAGFVTRLNCTSTLNGGTVGVTVSSGVDGILNAAGATLNTPGQTNGQGLQVETTGQVNLSAGTINAGDVYCNGTVTNTGGTLNISRWFFSPNGTGAYSQSAGALNLGVNSNLANGTFTITGGSVSGQNLLVGMSGNIVDAGRSGVAVTGNATVALSGTAITINGVLGVGNDGTLTAGTGTGHVFISSGSLAADTILLGSSAGGNGDLTVSGTGAVMVGGGLSSNDLTMNGGSLTVLNQAPPAGEDPELNLSLVGGYLRDGTFNMNAGTVTSPRIKLGLTSGKTGTMAMTGGTVNVGILGAGNDANINAGSGTGHITVSGGSLNADTILLGSTAGGSGDMTVSNTAQVTVGGGMSWNDLTVNGGSFTVLDQNPPPGEDPVLNRSMVGGYLRDGAMFLNAGTVTTPKMKLGVTAAKTGSFTQAGGTLNVGVFGVGNEASLTSGAGIGHATISAGTLNADTILLGSTAGGSGDLTVSGTAQVTVGGGLSSNDLIMNGGSLTVLDQNPPAGEDPALNRSLVAGYLRDGAVVVNAGTVTTPNLKIGVTPGFVGTLTMNGGSITTANLAAATGNGSVIAFNGGTINTAHSDVNGPGAAAMAVGTGTTSATLNLTAPAGTHTFADGLSISSSGHLTGTGTVSGNVACAGEIAPGNSAGVLTLTGILSCQASSALSMQLGGTAAGTQYDQINVSGNAALAGTLNLSLISNFTPALRSRFVILNAASVTGQFASVNAPPIPGGTLQVRYFSQSVVIAAVPTCAADFNGSGTVTVQDLFDYLAQWFAHGPSADFNYSGTVTVQDLFDFLTAWFAKCA